MITSREKIKEWFKTGAKPTQEQFYDWIDSYWHKYDDVSGILNQMQGATYMGEAHPDDVPPVTKQKVFYTATSAGTYTNFAGAVLASGEKAILLYDKAWSKITLSEIAQELGDSKEVAVSQKVVQSEIKRINNTIKEQIVQDFGQNTAKTISQKAVTEKFDEVETLAKTKMPKQDNAEDGNIAVFENGTVVDGKVQADNIAKQNGYYESMIVGASKNLAGNNVVTAKYTYRPTADTTDVADGVAKISSVKGNTIVWNQRYNGWEGNSSGISIKTLNGIVSLNGTLNTSFFNIVELSSKHISINLHHIGYYKCIIVKDLNGILQNKYFSLHNRNTNVVIVGSTPSFIYKNTNNSSPWGFGISGFTKGDVLEDVQIKVNVFDLTQMFGKGNEPTIEEFEAMFPADYYEYNEGELKSIEDFSIKSVGFNQWDEEWELGRYVNETGQPGAYSKSIRTKNFIRVIPNSNYYFNIPSIGGSYMGYCMYYDDSKNFVEMMPIGPDYHSTKLIPNNVHYISFYIREEYGTIYKNDISINLSHSGIRDGEYEPYQEDILPINISTIKDENGEQLFPNGLCSAREARDELVYDKGIGKWKAVKRIGSVDLGSLNWYTSWYADEGRIYADLISKAVGAMNIIYPLETTVDNDNRLINSVGICGNKNNTFIFIGQGATHTDSAAFIASLNGIYAYYELAEPIEVVLDNFTSNYKVSDWGTEEILMNSTPIVPVIYDVEYALNAVDTLRNMPTNYISKESLDAFLSALGSAMGGTWTATYNETNGRYDFSFSANASATELTEE